jgi:hypothetical protein
MYVKTIRKPDESGTQKFVARYGDRLVCVRYRYDATKRKRYKTVELIVEEGDWMPVPVEPQRSAMPDSRRVGIRVAYHERELRARIKSAGGTWSEDERLWRVPESIVTGMGLESRVVRK